MADYCQFALQYAKINALLFQRDMQEATCNMVQVQACFLCGEDFHDYDHCPWRQPEEEEWPVNSINNGPPFSQPYNAYCQSYVPPHEELEPAIPAEFNNFMLEQIKMNQMILEQMQAVDEKLARLAEGDAGVGSNSTEETDLTAADPTADESAEKAAQTAFGAASCDPQPQSCEPQDTQQSDQKEQTDSQPLTCVPQDTFRGPQDATTERQAEQNSELVLHTAPAKNKGAESVEPKPHPPPAPFSEKEGETNLDEWPKTFGECNGLLAKVNLLLLDGKLGSLPGKRELGRSVSLIARKNRRPSGQGRAWKSKRSRFGRDNHGPQAKGTHGKKVAK